MATTLPLVGRLLAPLATLLLGLSVPASVSGPQGCAGCFGTGAASTASNGIGAGLVKITLSVESGGCAWSMTEEFLLMECRPVTGCSTTVYREWSGLPPGSLVDFCVEVDDEDYCLKKQTVVDADGGGNSTRTGPVLPCSALAADQYTFKVRSDAAGLAAEASGRCSACQGDF